MSVNAINIRKAVILTKIVRFTNVKYFVGINKTIKLFKNNNVPSVNNNLRLQGLAAMH